MDPDAKRILIAEDHYVSRHLLERNLVHWGFTVLTAEDGEQALAILEGPDPPEMVLIDWMMPKIDGLEVCRRVRLNRDRPYTYLLLVTARSHKDEIAQALEAGVDDCLIKPFDSDELRARVKIGRRVVSLERALAARTHELEELRGSNA